MSNSNKQKIRQYNKLIELGDKYNLQEQSKQKVTSVLEDEVQYLLQKKQRQKEKKRRLKLLQDQFERKRKMKIEEFSMKNHQSEKLKQNVIKQKLQKNKKNIDHIQKVHKKANQQQASSIRKDIQKRKQFYSAQIVRQTKFNNKTQTQENFRKTKMFKESKTNHLNHSRTSQRIENDNLSVQKQMKSIEERFSKAKNNHLFYQQQMMSKFYEKQRHNAFIHDKIKSHSMVQQQKNFKQIYGKNQHIIEAQQRIKDLTEKHLSNRRKSFQQKLKKLHQNIKYIESEKIQKSNELENKISKLYENNVLVKRTGDLSGSSTHRQRVLINNLRIQQQKVNLDQKQKQKAEIILKKHSQITTKNKIYKQKKDQILQAIKKQNPQIEQ